MTERILQQVFNHLIEAGHISVRIGNDEAIYIIDKTDPFYIEDKQLPIELLEDLRGSIDYELDRRSQEYMAESLKEDSHGKK